MYGYELPIPAGKVMGCLPRQSRFGEWCPRAADRITVIPRPDWSKYTGKVSCRPFVQTILDQDGVGSCAAEAVTQAVMIARALAGLPHVVLNPWFMYRVTSGGTDSGSSIDSNLQFALENGIAPAALHPRPLGWRAKPSAEAVAAAKRYRIKEYGDIATIEELVSAELTNFPVLWGSDGHALCKVEHLNDREGLDANSWDRDWGDQGFGVWAPYSRINWGYGVFYVRVAEPSDGEQPPQPQG